MRIAVLLQIGQESFPRVRVDFCAKEAFHIQMEESGPTDFFAEVRKHATSPDKVKSENYKVLASIEEGIHGKKEEAIEPDKYYSTIITKLSSPGNSTRPVCPFMTDLTVVALSPSTGSSFRFREGEAKEVRRLSGSAAEDPSVQQE